MLRLTRVKENPILSPNYLPWEDLLVFNPGVTFFQDELLLLYRAMSKENQISRLGLARSKDGIHFVANKKPLYFGKGHRYETLGIEDVRVVKIEDTYYLVYTAVSELPQKHSNMISKKNKTKIPRIALSTTKDFVNFVDYDVILPQIIGKDASLFPNKHNGNYWLLYRVEESATYFASSNLVNVWKEGTMVFDKRPGFWDCQKAGIGAPPLETERGWLLFYHGVDYQSVYRLGVIFLDKDNPAKILYRSPYPIFEPEKDYEKENYVPNVVFTCGAVEKDNQYFVYYGAGDTVIGLATIGKQDLLNAF